MKSEVVVLDGAVPFQAQSLVFAYHGEFLFCVFFGSSTVFDSRAFPGLISGRWSSMCRLSSLCRLENS